MEADGATQAAQQISKKDEEVRGPAETLSSGTSSAILPRKGVIGERRRRFAQQDISLFSSIAGDLFPELGYL